MDRLLRWFRCRREETPPPAEAVPHRTDAPPVPVVTRRVFVSFASEDQAAVMQLCDALAACDVAVWASYKDIRPGAEWNQAIEDAMQAATHVIVAASPHSVGSPYVRAEVEYALDNYKTVIPALIDRVTLPLRWHTLQYVPLTRGITPETVAPLAELLPKDSVARLRALLETPQDPAAVSSLIRENRAWFGVDGLQDSSEIDPADPPRVLRGLPFDSLPPFFYRRLPPDANGLGSYDVRASLMSRLVLVFLGTPYASIFDTDGQSAPGFDLLLRCARSAVQDVLEQNMVTCDVYVLAGLREHYMDPDVRERRAAFERDWGAQFGPDRAALHIASYTRLLDRVTQQRKLF